MRTTKLVVLLFFGIGLLLLMGMIWQVGVSDLMASFRAVGLWLVPLVLLESFPMFLHTAGWAACFEAQHRPVGLWRLFLVRLAGSSINQMTPTATIGGEVVKVLLLESVLPRTQATASVIIDKASFTLAQVLHLTLGTLYLTGRLSLPTELQIALTCTLSLIALGSIGFVVCQRYGLLSRVLKACTRFKIGQEKLERLHQKLIPLEARLAAYYATHPWRFVSSLGLHVLAFAFGSVQTYMLLYLLLGTDAPGLAEAITIAVAIAALDQIFFFVPGNLGTLEGIRFMTLSVLGVAQVSGLAFGIIARLESLFWNGVGLLAYVYCTRSLHRVVPEQSAATSSAAAPPAGPA